jgi:hypothetical protein
MFDSSLLPDWWKWRRLSYGRASRTLGTALVDYQAMGRGCVFHRNKFVRLGGVMRWWDDGRRDRSEEAGDRNRRRPTLIHFDNPHRGAEDDRYYSDSSLVFRVASQSCQNDRLENWRGVHPSLQIDLPNT